MLRDIPTQNISQTEIKVNVTRQKNSNYGYFSLSSF